MKIIEVEEQFRSYLSAKQADLETLVPAQAIALMTGFFAEVPFEAAAKDFGDMLLLEWGMADWGDGENFELTVGRQVMDEGGKDADIRLLSLILIYESSPALQALDNGTIWREDKEALAEFAELVAEHPVLAAIASLKPRDIELIFDTVETD